MGKQTDSVIARVPKPAFNYRDLAKAHLQKKVGLKVVVGGELAVLGGDEAGEVTRSSLRLLLKLSQSTVVRLNLNRRRS